MSIGVDPRDVMSANNKMAGALDRLATTGQQAWCSFGALVKTLVLLIALSALITMLLYNYLLIMSIRDGGSFSDLDSFTLPTLSGRKFRKAGTLLAGGSSSPAIEGSSEAAKKSGAGGGVTEKLAQNPLIVEHKGVRSTERQEDGGLLMHMVDGFDIVSPAPDPAASPAESPALQVVQNSGKELEKGNTKNSSGSSEVEGHAKSSSSSGGSSSSGRTTSTTKTKAGAKTPPPWTDLDKWADGVAAADLAATEAPTSSHELWDGKSSSAGAGGPTPPGGDGRGAQTAAAVDESGGFGMGAFQTGKEVISFPAEDTPELSFSSWLYLPEIAVEELLTHVFFRELFIAGISMMQMQ